MFVQMRQIIIIQTVYIHQPILKSICFKNLNKLTLKVGQVKKNYTSHLTLILKFVFGGCFLFAILMLAVRNIWLRLCDL